MLDATLQLSHLAFSPSAYFSYLQLIDMRHHGINHGKSLGTKMCGKVVNHQFTSPRKVIAALKKS